MRISASHNGLDPACHAEAFSMKVAGPERVPESSMA